MLLSYVLYYQGITCQKLVNIFSKQSSLSYSLFEEFEINLSFDTSGEAIAAKDTLSILFIQSRVFKGTRKIVIKPNCWKMTKPGNNQPLIRFYANKNVKKYVLTGLVINT